MSESFIKNVIEAALLAAGRPLTVAEIAHLFDEAAQPGAAAIREALAALEQDYTGRGIEVKETANGFRIQVRREMANEVSRLWPERPPKYSRALLETLALVAYRQPITRAEIEAVRGVAVNPNIIKTLIERNWVKVVGVRDVPGRPELLGTTKDFLDYFGLRSLDELPPLAELKAMGDVNLQLDLAKDGATASDLAALPAPEAASAETSSSEPDANAAADGADQSEEAVAESSDSDAAAESSEEPEAARSAASENDDAGPKVRAAEAFVAEMESEDLDASADDDDDEGSESGTPGSGELVAAPPNRFED